MSYLKRTILLFILITTFASLSSASFVENDGVVLMINEESGTFSTKTKSNVPLKWTCNISRNRQIVFIIKENNKDDVRLSAVETSADKFVVKILYDTGFEGTYIGRVIRNKGVYNSISVDLDSDYNKLAENKTMTITISNAKATYNLGIVNIEELKSMIPGKIDGSCGGYIFYDKGYYSDGWRYLEAAPADIRLVDGIPVADKNEPGYDGAPYAFIFGYYRKTPTLCSTKSNL